jgi:hypothetical protein
MSEQAVEQSSAEIFDHRKADEERNLRLGQMLATKISLDIVSMIQKTHPGTHPAIVTTALVNCLATVIKLFSNGNMQRALEGSDEAHAQLKQTVLSMMLNANAKAN